MKRCCVLLFAMFLCMGSTAYSRVEFEITPGAGYLIGDNTYEIGDAPAELDPWGREPYFPISRLEFLLGVWVASLDARVAAGRWALSGGVRVNIDDKAGNMRDYDWGIPFWDEDGDEGPGWYVYEWTDGEHTWYALDIESKSKTEVNALIWEAKIDYELFTHHYRSPYDTSDRGTVRGYFGLGYEHRAFEYECRLIRQWSPSGIPGYDYTGDGAVGITYDVSYSIPYAEFTLAGSSQRLGIALSAGFSPFVTVRDEDVHLLRTPGPIYAEGKCTGNALKARADIRYDITSRWSVGVLMDYLFIRTSGEQDNVVYAGTDGEAFWGDEFWTTDEKITARQALFTFNVRYRFGLSR
ncbi:MAG TPA: omptin family outer membrane protease [Deltaproteobacteria bacterium]|nr:omptin family outer membrane protease [Deltaproteobacteria bacterium]